MKKYVPILVVIVLVLSIVGITRGNSVWASPQAAAGVKAPLKTLITVTTSGTSNVGGVCEITADFKTSNITSISADAEVLTKDSSLVPYNYDVNVYGHLLFPGCRFVFYKDTTKVPSPVSTNDATLKVCFGASPELRMGIFYYLDDVANPVWAPLPTTLEDDGKLICAPAQYNGVYMPTGMVVPPPGSEIPNANPFFQYVGGTVETPPANITITGSGTYAVGGICILTAHFDALLLSDTVKVAYPTIYTQDTKTIPSDALKITNPSLFVDTFYFPGCDVVHYRNLVIQDQMNMANTPKDGDWQICFAAIPGKTMTIYYYEDNNTTVTPPWKALTTKTANGMACADLIDFSAIYAPAGH